MESKGVEISEEAAEQLVEEDYEEVDVEFEALEDAKLDKALLPFETRELCAER